MKYLNFKNFSLVQLLLLVSFLNKIIFSILVPIWHTPDEQAHFAQVAYFGEYNTMPKHPPDLNLEILETEILLGTSRDEKGNNKFTFHPEYKIEYTNSLVGKYEDQIKNIDQKNRKILVKQEAANYPPLYYWITGITYKLFYNSDLITRVFASRFISILMGVLLTYISFLIAKELFPKNKLFQITIPILMTFQPMITFVFAGVSSDNLINLLYGSFLYFSIQIIKDRKNNKYLFLSILTIVMLFLTKPQFMLAIPTLLTALVISILIDKNITKIKKISLLAISFIIIGLFSILLLIEDIFSRTLGLLYSQTYFPMKPHQYTEVAFIQHLKNTLSHTIHEVIPWYWGVFDWLGVVFPIEIIRILNRIVIIAGIGLLIKFITLFKKRTIEDYIFIYLTLASLIYFAGITIYNYFVNITIGFSFGIQGRYYFPVIITHMAILFVGLIALIPKNFKDLGVKIITCLMISLNFFALYIISKTYYDLQSLNIFILQVSQYKIWFFKGNCLYFWGILYLLIFSFFLYKFLKLNSTTKLIRNH